VGMAVLPDLAFGLFVCPSWGGAVEGPSSAFALFSNTRFYHSQQAWAATQRTDHGYAPPLLDDEHTPLVGPIIHPLEQPREEATWLLPCPPCRKVAQAFSFARLVVNARRGLVDKKKTKKG
jgi:hypothetical protein